MHTKYVWGGEPNNLVTCPHCVPSSSTLGNFMLTFERLLSFSYCFSLRQCASVHQPKFVPEWKFLFDKFRRVKFSEARWNLGITFPNNLGNNLLNRIIIFFLQSTATPLKSPGTDLHWNLHGVMKTYSLVTAAAWAAGKSICKVSHYTLFPDLKNYHFLGR